MEDERKKKKKHKKNKNKQAKTTGDQSIGAVESCNGDQSILTEQNHQLQASDTSDKQEPVSNTDDDLGKYQVHDAGNVILEEKVENQLNEIRRLLLEKDNLEGSIRRLEEENDKHIQNEVNLKGSIRRLEEENDKRIQNEDNLKGSIRKLEEENDKHIQNEDNLKGSIGRLEEEIDKHIQNEDNLKGSIRRLEDENDKHVQNEVAFEETSSHLIREISSLNLNRADLEEKINHLSEEISSLNLERVSLKEKVEQLESERDFWNQKEVTSEEKLTGLRTENSRIHAQVIELEGCRNNLAEENQKLTETIACLQLKIETFEKSASATVAAGEEPVNAEMEAYSALIDKLITENAELIEKMNELYIELNNTRDKTKELYSPAGSDLVYESSDTIEVANPVSFPGERINLREETGKGNDGENQSTWEIVDSDSTSQSGKKNFEVIDITDEDDSKSDGSYYHNTTIKENAVNSNSQEITSLGEIENQTSVTSHDDLQNNESVLFTDAPLTGAPFRLISFFARYVSGADLVNKEAANSRL
ncbi:putative leucine-rich repeat-containing protein DDB_G0290503 isoform X2 [Impatiens glandulifera]|uniref:putative leucine-rich repeat-containing protein DDB_G0290503 isoform X2 n=1 Tax=Impatiens glandulifera TaxID=253017 RepID=UPI001FB11519|nr:putative leucine-rich repeat-containing protein DDB_G0290503 isoform X2 [Impatiens glandulifera]